MQKDLDISKSSLYILLKTLIRYGYVKVRHDGSYNLGFRLYELGSQAVSHINLRQECMPFLHLLRDHTNLTCHLGILDSNDAIYLVKLESSSTIGVKTWEGLRLSLHSSAVGKALLIDHDAAAIAALYPTEDLEVFTPHTLPTVSRLQEDLREARKRGWAFDDSERYEDLRCIAAPIRGVDGNIVAAVSVVGAAFQIPDARIPELAEETLRACAEMSRCLGHRPDTPSGPRQARG